MKALLWILLVVIATLFLCGPLFIGVMMLGR